MIEVWTWPTPNGHKVHFALQDTIAARPAVQRGVSVLSDNERNGCITDAVRKNMFCDVQFAKR
jgi:hypothetical protein